MGKDITSLVILPVWIMQPFTMLQNMAEIMEYTDQLDKAAVCDDPYLRCVAGRALRAVLVVLGGGGGRQGAVPSSQRR